MCADTCSQHGACSTQHAARRGAPELEHIHRHAMPCHCTTQQITCAARCTMHSSLLHIAARCSLLAVSRMLTRLQLGSTGSWVHVQVCSHAGARACTLGMPSCGSVVAAAPDVAGWLAAADMMDGWMAAGLASRAQQSQCGPGQLHGGTMACKHAVCAGIQRTLKPLLRVFAF